MGFRFLPAIFRAFLGSATVLLASPLIAPFLFPSSAANGAAKPKIGFVLSTLQEERYQKDQKYFHYIKTYSPYDNVERKHYPNILITAGLNDPRVTYWEPAKWCARLRELKTDKNLLLFRVNMGAGHAGQSGRYERFKETALEYAFLMAVIGEPVTEPLKRS